MSDDENSGQYKIGYGNPPHATQFQRGRSGNPKGRPKGAKNFKTVLAEELRAPVVIAENGRRRKAAKSEVLAKQLVNSSISGNMRSMALLLVELRHLEEAGGSGTIAALFGGAEQQSLIDGILQRVGATLVSSDQSVPPQSTEAAQLELPLEPPAEGEG